VIDSKHFLVGKVIQHSVKNSRGGSDHAFSRVISVSNNGTATVQSYDLMTGELSSWTMGHMRLAIEEGGKVSNRNGSIFLYVDEHDRPHRVDGFSNNLGRFGMRNYHLHGVGYRDREKLFAAIKDEEEQMDAVFGMNNE
jgi:hypothetical protein